MLEDLVSYILLHLSLPPSALAVAANGNCCAFLDRIDPLSGKEPLRFVNKFKYLHVWRLVKRQNFTL